MKIHPTRPARDQNNSRRELPEWQNVALTLAGVSIFLLDEALHLVGLIGPSVW